MSMSRNLGLKVLAALLLFAMPLSLLAQRRKKRAAAQETSNGIDYKSPGAPLPEIRAVYPNKAVYTNKELQNDANLFVMLVLPTCEHCQEMALNLGNNLSLFKKSNILMMAAPNMGPYLEFFENTTRLREFPAIRLGLDSANYINKVFRYENLPQVNIYSPEGKLLKVFNGLTTVDSLKAYIQ